MINLTSEQINTAFEKLPDEVILAMNKINLDSRIKELCDQNGLNEDTTKNINFLVNLKIVKLIDENELRGEIKNFMANNISAGEKITSSVKEILDILDNEVIRKKELTEILSQEIVVPEEDFRFINLPQSVQDAISLSDWQGSLLEIAKENKLNIEQSGILEDITIKTMRNEISHSDYPSKISSGLGLDNERTSKIVSSVAGKIFDKIRTLMREQEDSDYTETGIPLPPYKKDTSEEEISGAVNIATPIPPYKKVIEEIEVQKKDLSDSDLLVNDILSDKTMTSNVGGIQSLDFSIPKTEDKNPTIKAQGNIVSETEPKINHDPYREII